jgi:1-acyl-sn-glycerol-3-phosphate acyltransferase
MRNWCYYSGRVVARVLLWPFVRLHIWRAPGAIEPSQAAVVVANHISHFDPILLGLSFRPSIDWMTADEFYQNPFLGALLRAFNTIPVNRSRPDQLALRRAVRRLRAQNIIGVFPDGGIRAGATSILEGATPKSGATALAKMARVPIVPCVIFGSDRLYAPRSWWPGPPRVKTWIGIGAPFEMSDANDSRADTRLLNAVRELGAATIAHFALQPDDLPASPARRKGKDPLQTHNES